MTYKTDISYNELMNIYTRRHPGGERDRIKTAFLFASEKHEGKMRKSGEPYINHPLRTARLLAEHGFGEDYLIAALLHDVVEDCNVPLSEIRDLFGRTVAKTVDAVTSLSDRDFNGQKLTKKKIDLLSDAKLQNKMNIMALYVKIADRIDNLSTISCFSEKKQLLKAQHTREILIPMAIQAKAFFFVDVLEDLCFHIEHARQLEQMEEACQKIRAENRLSTDKALNILEKVFDPLRNNYARELDPYRRYIISFSYADRTMVSLFRQATSTDKLRDIRHHLRKDTFAFHDIFLTVSNDLEEEGTPIRPHDLFFKYFELVLSKEGFYIVDYKRTTHKDSTYFLLADDRDNLYRLFIRTQDENDRYRNGNFDDDRAFFPGTVNELDPRDTYKPKIKVFRADGTAMMIDSGSTVLDFAFHIHTGLGLHFKYANLNGNPTQLPAYTRLNDRDTVVITKDEEVIPTFTWFKYVRTSRATDRLIRFFYKLYADERGCPFVLKQGTVPRSTAQPIPPEQGTVPRSAAQPAGQCEAGWRSTANCTGTGDGSPAQPTGQCETG